jgi:phage terminase small subunit
MTSSLTPKQEKFCQKYIETGNASEAYRQSYDAGKMKPETVNRTAKELLDNPKIAARINEIKALHLKRHNVTVDRVLQEFARLAFLDPRKIFDKEGRLRPITELDDDTAAAIAGLEVEDLYEGRGESREHVGRLHKIKLCDKKGSLDSLARHLQMFTDKAEISGPNGGPIETQTTAIVATLNGDLKNKSLDELTRLFSDKIKG